MADFNQPILTTGYSDLLDELKARDVDALSLAEAPTNPPTGAIRWNRTDDIFQEWSGSAWVDMQIKSDGIDPGVLGTMASQNSNAVAITGGSISGLTTFDLANHLTFLTDVVTDLGSATKGARYVYINGGLKVPVGTDKYVP